MSMRRAVLFFLLLVHAAFTGAHAFPDRPITLVCGFAPGAAADAQLRALAKAMSRNLDQPVIVENRPGAAGALAASAIANGPTDGHMLVQVTNSVIRQPFMTPTPYDPVHSFTYVIGVSAFDFGLVVNASSPWTTFQQFISFAKQNPAKVTYGSIGIGSVAHRVMEQIREKVGADWTHVSYRGSAPGQVDLQGGHISALSDTGWAPLVDAGKLRLLAVYGKERLTRYPNVPTLTELGLDISEEAPWGLAAPRAVPPDRVKVLHDAARRALDDTEFKASLEAFASEVRYLSTEQYQAYMAARVPVERDVVERYKLRQP